MSSSSASFATVPTPAWFAPALAALLQRQDLDEGRMTRLMEGLLAGECGDVETAALLVALRMKGETAGELASAAAVLRQACQPLATGPGDVLDTCGTGG